MTRTFLAAALMISGAVASAETLVANIPFAFHVPGAQLPAGKYVMTRGPFPNFDAYYFREAKAVKSHLVPAPIRKTNWGIADSRLTFRCTGDQCELTDIQSAVQGVRNGVYPSLKTKGLTGTEISWRTVEIKAAD